MTNLTDELQKRLAQKPDEWTLAWWKSKFEEVLKAYRGATHATNCVLAQVEDDHESIKALHERILSLEADRAKIGELQARVERMAEFLSKLKGKNHDGSRTG